MARRARNTSASPSRSASTVSHSAPRRSAPPPVANTPVPHHAPSSPAVQTKQPGMFAQMASTAAGVAVGSAVGHTMGAGLTSMFGGGNNHQAPVADAAPVQSYESSQSNMSQMGASCDPDLKAYLKCMESSNNDVQSCNYYLEMLKACQTRFA